MHSSLILLLAQCIHGNFLLVKSTQDQLLYTPQDYQNINELLPQRQKNSYASYYSPVASKRNDFIANADETIDKLPMESKVYPKRALLIQQIPKKKIGARYLSRYLEPPSSESVSNYAKYHGYLMNLENEERLNYFPRNHRPDIAIEDEHKKIIPKQGPFYIRDHAPLQQAESESEQISESKPIANKSLNKKSAGTLELSADGDRIEFQIQGHEGPKTYIFGFDTGDGKNRQFRLEERLKDGTVKGHYGYYDARGKLRAIKYLARPFEGYEEKHHELSDITYKDLNNL
ncbi:PREDICTED: uncharacterized protein LOC105362959 [Ceratosolen solmsi marchali]|uniref:Uncharacterized protein LOC105362959 n=1 Tax=Ceratosolen solmsi marchali TaxID=326594 RepID=A0AAJ6YIS1_9HYME|nr:PREDICTED: uncharacterized protein LOC105362959 [Ceratosolen solmsi marchali]